MYKVEKVSYGRFSAHRLVDQTNDQYFEVLSDFGAGINDLVVKTKKGTNVSVISGYRSEDDIRYVHHTKFAGSKLSPFPNRIVEGQFQYAGQDFQLPVNEYGSKNHLHGFLHNKKCEVISQVESDEMAEIVLRFDYLGTIQGFPYSYSLTVTYHLDAEGVRIDTLIQNTSDTDIPMGDGWHPYFVFDNLNKVKLTMGKAERVSSLVGNVLTPTHGFEAQTYIEDQVFDDCFAVNEGMERFEVNLLDEDAGLDITLWQESGHARYKYCQVYTPPSRKEIAIEPVSCPPNALNTNEGVVILTPGEEMKLTIGISF